ncbi:MAG: efflux RND transporter periplasmic adaptor subunit [Terriglobia bacterium]|jgi:HlyD family secretion protein
MKRSDWVLCGALAVALGVPGCANESQQKASPAGSPQPSVTQVPAQPPSVPPADTLEIPSVLSVEHSVDLLSQRDGIVQEVFYDQDSWAKKGTVLARLDDRELLASLEKARLDQRVAENNFKYQEAEKKAKDAAYRRQQELHKYGLSTQSALEEAEFQSTGAGFDLDSWKAAIEQKKAAIRELEIELEKTRIVAPFDGYIVRRAVRAGQNVIKNDFCFHISELYPLQVRFLVPESAGPRPRVGSPLKVVLGDDQSRAYNAHVKLVSPTVDAASASYDLTAELTGSHLQTLRPGMAVRVIWTIVPVRGQSLKSRDEGPK